MKKSILFAALIFSVAYSQAKIWRVNNVPGVAADFTTAQAAHDGASAGDTIYLESSSNTYGDVTTSKRLVWISLGYFLSNNPGLQYHVNSGFVSTLTVNPGSDNSVFQITATAGITVNSAANLLFQRCYVGSIFSIGGTSNHITITQCYMTFNNYLNIDPSVAELSFTVTNNIFVVPFIYIRHNAYQVTFNNNTYITNPSNYSQPLISNATIANNIFVNTANAAFYDAGFPSNLDHNTWVGITNSIYVGANNNTFSANFSDVFAGGSSPDGQYQLAAGSPAIGTGAGGVDRGAYGSADPYVLSGIPPIPTIYQLSVPANATGNSLPCTVSTKANN